MEHLLSLPNDEENIDGREKENLGAQAADAENDAVLVDPADESDNFVSQSEANGVTDMGGIVSDAFTVDDAKECIQGIQEDIKKYALRLLGKDK